MEAVLAEYSRVGLRLAEDSASLTSMNSEVGCFWMADVERSRYAGTLFLFWMAGGRRRRFYTGYYTESKK